MKSTESGTYAHGVVAISVAVHDEVWGLWSPCGGSSIKKVGPGENEEYAPDLVCAVDRVGVDEMVDGANAGITMAADG